MSLIQTVNPTLLFSSSPDTPFPVQDSPSPDLEPGELDVKRFEWHDEKLGVVFESQSMVCVPPLSASCACPSSPSTAVYRWKTSSFCYVSTARPRHALIKPLRGIISKSTRSPCMAPSCVTFVAGSCPGLHTSKSSILPTCSLCTTQVECPGATESQGSEATRRRSWWRVGDRRIRCARSVVGPELDCVKSPD